MGRKARQLGPSPRPPHLLTLLLLALLAAPALAAERDAALSRADAAWEQRADGCDGEGRARPEPIGRAIAAYLAAVESDPQALAPRWKLVRALYFAADFAGATPGEELRLLDRATREADAALDLLARRIGVSGSLDSFDPTVLAASLAPADAGDAAGTFFWSAVAWGAWGQRYGTVDAVRAGVAGRLYQGALAVAALDPAYEEGGAYRLLTRIHAQVPRIPFFTGFVDRSRAVPEGERALAIAPGHPANGFLLALTLLDVAPERHEEALHLLQQAAAAEPRPGQLVEDLAVRRAALERLAQERGAERRLAQESAAGG